MTNKPGRAVVVASGDEHCGHPFALAHPEPWSDYNGAIHQPNELQQRIWEHWCDCWRRVGEMRRGARLIVIRMGDSVEGSHHDTTQLDTQRRPEQESINVRCWREALELCSFRAGADRLLGIIGTEAHVGLAGESDERTLRAILHADTEDGRLTTPRLRISVNGVAIEAWHRGAKPGARDWTKTNSLQATMRDYLYRNLKRGRKPVRFYLWAHYHEFAAAALQDDAGQIISEGFVVPAFKLKDEFVYTVAAEGLANVGLWVANIAADGVCSWQALRLAVEQDVEVTL